MSSTKSFINISNKYDRIIVLVDMDCFYCQVEEKLDPSLKGKPIAVVQYNAWKGGGIIAVNYAARAQGVTRHMRGDEAKEQCPDIILVKVPSVREKADLTKYREAGKEVAMVLQKFTKLLERASVDEAYLDITEEVIKRIETMDQGDFRMTPSQLVNTYAIGYDHIGEYVNEISKRIEKDSEDFDCDEEDLLSIRRSDIKLLIGASIVSEIRAKVKEKTGYECSAGIAHNKILAKLACGINKPDKQTILPLRMIQALFSTLPVGKIKGLGGKHGEEVCEMLGIKYVGDLKKFSEAELQRRFDEKNGSWLYLLARGIDLECITPRFYSKSIGCCKKFPGRGAITGTPTLEYWLEELANEIADRMDKDIIENNRRAKQMVVSYVQEINGDDVSSSRSAPLPSYDPKLIANCCLDLIKKNTEQYMKPACDKVLNNPIKFLGISVGKFATVETNKNTIKNLFLNHSKMKTTKYGAIEMTEKSQINENIDDKSEHAKREVTDLGSKESTSNCTENDFSSSEKPIKTTKSFFLNAIKRRKIEAPQPENTETTLNTNSIEINRDYKENKYEERKTKLNKGIENAVINNIEATSESSSNEDSSINAHFNQPGTSSKQTNKSYFETYAEFQIPTPTEEECTRCHKMIPSYDIDVHNDYHFALEMRDSDVSALKKDSPSQSQSAKKTLKTHQTNRKSQTQSNNVTTPIHKFLSQTTNSDKQTITAGERCPECEVWIEIDRMSAHLDFHMARRLQRKWNESGERRILSLSLKRSGPGKKSSKIFKAKDIQAFFPASK